MLRIFDQLIAKVVRFAGDRRGNVALTFGIATLPLIGAVGAAVDFSHANSVKAAMQSALDSTALMLARDASTMADPALDTKAQAYFMAMFTRPEATNIVVNATYSTSAGSQVVVTGSAKVPTTIMSIAGYTNMTINGEATAKWGSQRLRVALALDNTGSMAADGKMTALKSATKSLLNQLKGAASKNGDVYVSIVPFNKDVNVGSSNYTANWLNWTVWDALNTVTSGFSGSICYNGTLWEVNGSGFVSKGPCSGNGGGICYNGILWKFNGIIFYNAGSCTHQTWNGCVTDRGAVLLPSLSDYDRKITAPSLSILESLFVADQYGSCPVAMKGLSYDWSAMEALVDSMEADGMTNQPIGLVWAWQSLVGGGPLTAPSKDSNYTYNEVIVLMSDGLNTQNRWWSSQSQVDKRMYDASKGGEGTCANIKAAGIKIYTVHVNTGGDPMSTLLQNCASGPENFWMITSADQLSGVFSKIGTDITKLRVAK
jgi:Flp pilus assembly protein TadG